MGGSCSADKAAVEAGKTPVHHICRQVGLESMTSAGMPL